MADSLPLASINQGDIPERGQQVKQMRRIYENAETVLIWLGADNVSRQAKLSVDSVVTISDFMCEKLNVSLSDLADIKNIYEDLIFMDRDKLPRPDETDFSSAPLWEALVWFYAHPYFTRVWVIQELTANKNRIVYCGRNSVEWDRVELVAGYLILETSFSKDFGFSGTYCWWASTAPGEMTRNPRNWLNLLYLATNFNSTDPRDVIYGLRGLIESHKGSNLLDPDYSKSTADVYRDSVEAAMLDYEKTDVLCYLAGNESPSWVPNWDKEMLFRNPFRFGRPMPWRPAGDTAPEWNIDREKFILSISGFPRGSISIVEPYRDTYFGDAVLKAREKKELLGQAWERILGAASRVKSIPLKEEVLTAIAVSFTFGLDDKSYPSDSQVLLYAFVAYLRLVLEKYIFDKYVPPDLDDAARDADGHAFGKPIWDFEYPESSFFITENGLLGCCMALISPGDLLFAPLGSTYLHVLHPEQDYFLAKGFAFAHGIMYCEGQQDGLQTVRIH